MKPRRVQLTIGGDKPIEVSVSDDAPEVELSDEQRTISDRVAETFKAYRKACKDLVDGKFEAARHLIPAYLANPGNIIIFFCTDGVVVRFDRNEGSQTIALGHVDASLETFVPQVSQNSVFCYGTDDFQTKIAEEGVQLGMSVYDADGEKKNDVFSIRIGFDAVLLRRSLDDKVISPKPFCIVSAENSFELMIEAMEYSEGAPSGDPGRPFVIRSHMRLPVGWERLEVYPFIDLDEWNPNTAHLWAELEILGAVVARQLREVAFDSLDPKASARQHYSALLKEYKELLESSPKREEVLQQFLREHPELLSPSYVALWPKLALGANVTDFVFREATGEYVLVELERSTLNLFRKDGHPTQELTHAQGQIFDWKRYIEDNLGTVQRELALPGISSNPHGLIVMGRSDSLNVEGRRKLRTMRDVSPRIEVLTYDDVYDRAKAVVENLLGSISEQSANTKIYYIAPGSSLQTLLPGPVTPA